MLFLRNLRHGLRLLRRNPSFAVSAIAVMALGIGATTAVFSVVKGVLLTPLPYREPGRVVLFRADVPGYVHQAAINREELHGLRDRTDLFESVGVLNESPGSLTSPDHMEPVTAVSASDNFLATLGVTPILGRAVTRKDVAEGFVNAVTISYDLWERRFQRDPEVVGRALEVNNLPMRMVGVLPKGFRLHLGPGVIVPAIDIWYPRPLSYDDEPFRGRIVIARLKDGVSLETVRAAVATLATRLVAEYPSSYTAGPVRLSVSTLDQEVVSEVKPSLAALSGAVGFVLLVACANLANLLLARASARSREVAVRVSIGASRAHIAGQLAAEGVVLGVFGAAGGLLIATWCVDALLLLAPATLPRREVIGVDAIAAMFAVGAALVCAIAASLVPAWQATRTSAIGALKQATASSRSAATIRGVLAAGQLALSLVLLIGAGLMGRAFISLRSVPLGFDADRALTMSIELHGQRFNQGTLDQARASRLAFYRQLSAAVRQIPGVEQAGVGMPVPLKGMTIVQRFVKNTADPERQAEASIAFEGYLEALGVPLVAGRTFTTADETRPVVIVDERLTRELWPNQSAIGQRLALMSNISGPRWVEVIGVAGHVQSTGLRAPGLPQIWMTYASKSYSSLDIVIRGEHPASFIGPVKEAVQRLGAGRPVHDVRLLRDYVADASADTRFAVFVLGAFAMFALVLAVIGVYAVVAYATARRTREIAVRLALGADPRRIVSLVMRQGAVWIAAGLLAGIVGARLLTGYLAGLLFRVTQNDAVTFACVAAGLSVVAMTATAIPALRAARIDPMLSLKAE
jgi:putative ABC transport system permease protein